jgi:O-antigen ligase
MKIQLLPRTFLSANFAVYLFGAILLGYPVLLFLVRGGMSGSLFLLAIFSFYLLFKHRGSGKRLEREEVILCVAMSSWLIAIFISQLYHHNLDGQNFDSATRFLLVIPVFLAARYVPAKIVALIQYAFPLGAIAALGQLISQHSISGLGEVMTNPALVKYGYTASTSFMNHIHLGDLALLLGFLSVFSINWYQADSSLVKILKIAGLMSGVAVSILSSARGGWIAAPIFVALFIQFRIKGSLLSKAAITIALLSVATILGFIYLEPVRQRILMAYSDIFSYGSGNTDTSIGIRLDLWKVALRLIAENPVFGVGADGFGRAMNEASRLGQVSALSAAYGQAEVHNEILASAVRFGILGLFSILSLYFVPFAIFAKAAKSLNKYQKNAALMGMCVTLGFFIFGLTVETFDLKMTASFYSLTIAVLLAAVFKKSELPDTSACNTRN